MTDTEVKGFLGAGFKQSGPTLICNNGPQAIALDKILVIKGNVFDGQLQDYIETVIDFGSSIIVLDIPYQKFLRFWVAWRVTG